MRPRQLTIAATALLALSLLTACDPAGPDAATTPTPEPSISSARPTPTPTPTEDPGPEAAAIVIDGESISVLAADLSVILDVPYSTEGELAAAQLAEAIGVEPAVTLTPGNGTCTADTTHYSWGGLELRSPGGIGSGGGAIDAFATAATIAEGLPVQLGGGVHVGSTLDEMLAGVPGSREMYGFGYYDIHGDIDDTSHDSDPFGGFVSFIDGVVTRFGGFVSFIDGVVTRFGGPVYYFHDC